MIRSQIKSKVKGYFGIVCFSNKIELMHKSVLLKEVIENLAPKDGEIYVDATFGAGGYTKAILRQANCQVFGIDRDPNVANLALKVQEEFNERFTFLQGKFSQIEQLLADKNVQKIDGIVFDLGVSSMQFDEKDRGFSFDSDAKLDMRMDGLKNPLSAFEIVNNFSESELANIFWEFGEEKKSRLIAKKIAKAREAKKVTSCRELADIVRSCYAGYFKIDPATRCFQALRIFVNSELDEISLALKASKDLLQKGGRLIVVSFHGLEDKIVKDFLKKQAGIEKSFSRYEPENEESKEIGFEIVKKSAIKPSEKEVKENFRSRSARMRVGIRV